MDRARTRTSQPPHPLTRPWTGPRASRAAAASAAGLFPWPVPQPFLRPLRLSVALVDNRYLLGPLKVRLSDQRVRDEEFGEVTLMTLFLPDPALELLLIIRDRALAAQVKGDGDLDHRDGLRRYRAENVLLVVVGHGHASGAIPVKEGADLGHRVGLGPVAGRCGAVLQVSAVLGARLLIPVRPGRLTPPSQGPVAAQLQSPFPDADEP